jgi:hypothetical protein
MGSSGGFSPVPITRLANPRDLWIPASGVLKKDAMGYWLSEGPGREEPFTAVPITPVAPTPYGISPFQKNVPSAVFPSWLRSKGREGLPNDVLKKNAGIVN